MQKKEKLEMAAQRTSNKKTSSENKTKTTLLGRIIDTLLIPVRAVGLGLRRFWQWICTLNIVGLINLTLLTSIIVLFSLLIMDILKYDCIQESKIIDAEPVPVVVQNEEANNNLSTENIASLPIKKDEYTRKFLAQPVNVVPVKKCEKTHEQTARIGTDMYGDIIIDSREAATVLNQGDNIHGNLYLQNMRKYILPCDIKVNGNLFVRDIGMLVFCGDFTVTGNIYVSPRSSFGALPRTARLGGQVIL